ncbi:hypothetical protein P691DRAFT_790655 [Macrolepiota fuliginosa MF-IS2]|uniref:Uncharacterized protein n=1 Tax=Macrolepiota fuliginosa MF-IS2 TaxID=1400762 RepID=A0A9P6BXK1_9AGAR|nr:hypothetical protein P691DRAFT_790655 [Macrolepiota fuliginosa MF-IS2]
MIEAGNIRVTGSHTEVIKQRRLKNQKYPECMIDRQPAGTVKCGSCNRPRMVDACTGVAEERLGATNGSPLKTLASVPKSIGWISQRVRSQPLSAQFTWKKLSPAQKRLANESAYIVLYHQTPGEAHLTPRAYLEAPLAQSAPAEWFNVKEIAVRIKPTRLDSKRREDCEAEKKREGTNLRTSSNSRPDDGLESRSHPMAEVGARPVSSRRRGVSVLSVQALAPASMLAFVAGSMSPVAIPSRPGHLPLCFCVGECWFGCDCYCKYSVNAKVSVFFLLGYFLLDVTSVRIPSVTLVFPMVFVLFWYRNRNSTNPAVPLLG